MSIVKINDIKDQVEELVTRVQAGETILIERDGQTVARIVPMMAEPSQSRPTKIDVTALREFTQSQPLQKESAGEFIRRMRDEDRY